MATMHIVRVPPTVEYCAEVVILLTTLGAKRVEFNAGKRGRDLLEIKRVHHKVIDFNRDARQAGTGEAENKAIQKLMSENKLATSDDDDLILPQIFIDSNYIGDAGGLQGLEDDELLDRILKRKLCAACYVPREPSATQCSKCYASFGEILPGELTIEDTLRDIAENNDDYDDEDDDDYDDDDDDADDA